MSGPLGHYLASRIVALRQPVHIAQRLLQNVGERRPAVVAGDEVGDGARALVGQVDHRRQVFDGELPAAVVEIARDAPHQRADEADLPRQILVVDQSGQVGDLVVFQHGRVETVAAAILVAVRRALLIAVEAHVGDAIDPAAHRRPAAGQAGARRGDAGGLVRGQSGIGHGAIVELAPDRFCGTIAARSMVLHPWCVCGPCYRLAGAGVFSCPHFARKDAQAGDMVG